MRRTGDFLPDGPYLAQISGGGTTLTVRVQAERQVPPYPAVW